jgi:hypothetical protein
MDASTYVDYHAAIEALDKKACRVHTVDDWRRVGEKSHHAPGTLTDDDITIIGFFDGEKSAANARARRAQALTPPAPPIATPSSVKASPAGDQAFPGGSKTIPPEKPSTSDDLNVEEFLRMHGSKAVTYRELHKVLEDVAGVTVRLVKAQKERADTLEARVKELEAQPRLKYAGVHIDGQPYSEAQLVTRAGSLWISTMATRTTPGTPGSDWQLVVKRGHA